MDRPVEADVIAYLESLSNWGRWGEDDEIGTLNLITHEKIAQSAALVSEGLVISCSRLISTVPTDVNRNPLLRLMVRSGDASPEFGPGGSSDWIGLRFHGQAITHLDALSHYVWNQKTYNGRPASLTGTQKGAEFGSVELAKHGIVSRGVLLDVARAQGVEFLPPGYEITPSMLEACEAAQDVRVEAGDALIVRTGRDVCVDCSVEARPGLRADCLPWLHQREISLLIGDATHDVKPSPYETVINPIHTVGIVALGLWLLDNAYVEDVAQHCAEIGRWTFQFVASPLVLENTTGCPINPLAIF